MKPYETLSYIDSLLFELWYTDDSKSDFDKELYDWIENLYSYLNKLEIQYNKLKKENRKLKQKLN